MNAEPADPCARQRGFTIVELMVATTISLFLLGMIGGAYLLAKQTFWNTTATAAMDQSARAIFNMIGNSVRQARFNGCASLGGTYSGDTRNITAANLTKWWNNLATPVYAEMAGGSDFPTAVTGTNVLILIGVDSANEADVISDDPTSAAITVGANNFTANEVLTASSCQLNSFFVVDSLGAAASGATISHGGSNNCSSYLNVACAGGSTANSTPASYALQPGTPILPVVAGAYYVAPSATTGKGNSLWYASTNTFGVAPTGVEVANGVADMQLAFGLDTTGGGSVTTWVNSLDTSSTPGTGTGTTAPAIANWNQVIAVRVDLLMVSQPDSSAASAAGNSFTYNGVTYTPGTPLTGSTALEASLPAGNQIYREYAMTFSLRNSL